MKDSSDNTDILMLRALMVGVLVGMPIVVAVVYALVCMVVGK